MTDVNVIAPIHSNVKTTLPRIKNFITSTRFKETNLVGKLYPEKSTVDISHWPLPGGEGAWQSFEFNDIIKNTFTPVSLNSSYGPTWSTHWFKLVFAIPNGWVSKEVRLRWDSESEATLWSETGSVLQGFSANQKRSDYVLYKAYPGSLGKQTYYVEMTVSKMFGAADSDIIDPPNENLSLSLKTVEIAVMDSQIYKLTTDLDVLRQLAENMSTDSRGYMAMYTANQMVNDIIAGDLKKASDIGTAYFVKGNGERSHTIAAIGNCHIDTAWLWPYSETKRKAARSFSSQLKLMEDYPDFRFVASQAQQWAWIKEYYPELFDRLKAKVASGEFLPVGTTWVEMDGNIPSGESFIRQFFYGHKFYLAELAYECKEYWLPDTFGYSAQIPGLMKHVGLERFLTQKMSWSMVNKFPHHNFIWQGIDGSEVIVHFPPGDSYTMNFTVEEVMRTERNLLDKGRVSTSAFLYGFGDGGGGPTQNMIETARRLADTDGCPKVIMTTPNVFFDMLETEKPNLMKWVGELFLELHNGTYTSQADMKKFCRLSEFSLRNAEYILSIAHLQQSVKTASLRKSMARLEKSWKDVLLNQFHDVLPGSGIAIVYPDAMELYNASILEADNIFKESVEALFGNAIEVASVAFNTLQWPRREVIENTKDNSYSLLTAPAFGYGNLTSIAPTNPVLIKKSNGTFTMENGLVRAVITANGQLTSLFVIGKEIDLLQGNGSAFTGNQITLYDDEPLYWDAWDIMDYHLETPVVHNDSTSTRMTNVGTIVTNELLIGQLNFKLKLGENSTFSQDIILKADTPYLIFDTKVNWLENHKVLKAVFDTNLHIKNASFDIQFGFLERPTHMNTSWDTARYEVCGHKWADISQPDIGMAVLNDSKYGWCARGNSLSLTLLKAPKAPDDTCDMREHNFMYAVMPHIGTLQKAEVMRRSYEFNNPLKLVDINKTFFEENNEWTTISVEGSGIMLHTIKPADNLSKDLILRFYEYDGCLSSVNIVIPALVTAKECNGLEIAGIDVPSTSDATTTTIKIKLGPFQIYALRITPK